VGFIFRDKLNFSSGSAVNISFPSGLVYHPGSGAVRIILGGAQIMVPGSWGLVPHPTIPAMYYNGQMDENYFAVQVSSDKNQSAAPASQQVITINGRQAGISVSSIKDSDLFHTGLEQISISVYFPGKNISYRLLIITTGNFYTKHIAEIQNLIASFSQ
jgi:hypothetical protein